MTKPDFTGTWKFNPGKSVLQIPAPDSTILVLEHCEPVFRVRRTHVLGQTSDVFTLDLTTDGRAITVDKADAHIRARAYWDNDTLVFDTSLVRQGEEATNVVRYSLIGSHDGLTAEERFRGSHQSYDNVWVMDRE